MIWIVFAGLFASTFAAYWNSFCGPFVFDDLQTIQRNASVRFGDMGWAFYPRALLFKTFSWNSLWSGQEVWSYHVVNFVLHFLNGLLVFLIADRILRPTGQDSRRSSIYAALAAALFLLHPIQTESVTYISSRSELLSTFFYLVGFLVFILWPVNDIGLVCGAVVGLVYVLGMGAKETAITLPAAIFLYDFIFLSSGSWRRLLLRWRFYSLYIAGVFATSDYLLTVGLKDAIGSHVPGNLAPWHYFLTETRVLVRYIQLIFLPLDLNLDYDFRPSLTVFDPVVLMSVAILLGLAVLAYRLRRSGPVFAFSIFWFFLTLAPTSSIAPITDVIFEHRMYLPLAGLAISFPLLMEKFSRRVYLYCCCILVALLIGTVARNYVWGDEVRLFTDVVAKSPLKKRPYNALAFAYYKRGDYDHAVTVLEQGQKKIPDSAADLGHVLATMYLKQGQYDKAIALFQKELQVTSGPQLAETYNSLGMAYLYAWIDLQNRHNEMTAAEFDSKKEQVLTPAADAFLKSLQIAPDTPATLDEYINTMYWLGKGGELESSAFGRLKTNPKPQKVQQFSDLYTIGEVAFNNGDYAKADNYFEEAEKINKDVKILYFNHGYALTKLKQDERAIEKYIQAIRIEPIFIEAHHNLGLIYMRRNQYDKAIESFTAVLRLEPKHARAHLTQIGRAHV